MLTRRGFPREVRRALRASGALASTRDRRRRPLPDELRMRLLDLPRLAPPPRVAVVPRSTGGDFNPTGSTWLLASPLAPLAASFVLVVAVGVLFGNPYRVGAATFVELRTEVSPAASALRDGASRVAAVAAGLGQAAVESLPDAGRRASGAIARSFKERESSRPLPETPRR